MKHLLVIISVCAVLVSCSSRPTKTVRAHEVFMSMGEYKNYSAVELIKVDTAFRTGDLVDLHGTRYRIVE